MVVIVGEEIQNEKLRVFRWNEKLFRNEASESDGLCLFKITTKIISVYSHPYNNTNKIAYDEETKTSWRVVPFKNRRLWYKDQLLGQRLVFCTNEFMPETIVSLGDRLSDYLFSRFRFNPDPPNSPKIVIVVEVCRKLRVNFSTNIDLNVLPSDSSWMHFPPDSPPPGAYSRSILDSDDDEDWSIFDDYYGSDDEAADDDLWNEYAEDIRIYLFELRYYLGEGCCRHTRPITTNEPAGFVEVIPMMLQTNVDFKEVQGDKCPICLVQFAKDTDFVKTKCSHVFHFPCISQWLSKHNSCPNCRLALPLI